MTQYVINIGALPNDGTGDPLRTAFNETNQNFDQVFAAGPVLSNVRIANNTISTITSNGNLVLAPNGIGRIQANATILPSVANVRDLGSADQRWNTVYTQYVNISGILTTNDLTVNGNLTVDGDIIQIGNLVTDAKTIQLANTANTANAANGSGITVGADDNIATVLYSSASNTWNTNIGISAVGNITAPYFIGNGSQLTGLPEQYGNSNVTTLLSNLGSNIISGTGNITTTGNISGGYILGDGSQLTGLPEQYGNANVAAYLDGTAGNLIPVGNNTQSLGNATNQWSDLYVSNATIYMNNVPLSLTADNVLTVNGEALLSNDSNTSISTSGNITANFINADHFIGNIVVLGTSGLSRGDDDYIVYEGQVPSGIRPSNPDLYNLGNTGYAWQEVHANVYYGDGSQLTGINVTTNIIANGNTSVGIPSLDGPAEVTVDGNTWSFDTVGNLTLPQGGIVYETSIPGSTITGNTIALKPSSGIDADQQLLIYPTAAPVTDANHLHLTSGNLYNTELFLGNDDLYVKLANTGNIVINSNDAVGNTAQWTFNTFGTLTLPGGSRLSPLGANLDIFAGTGSYVNLTTSDESSRMGVDNGGGYIVTAGGTWGFSTTGNLTAPGNITTTQSIEGLAVTARNINADYGNISLNPDFGLIFTNSNAVVTANTQSWTFDDTGNLTIPGASGGLIKTVPNASIGIVAVDNGTDNPAQLMSWNVNQANPNTIVSTYANSATIMTDVNGTAKTWSFDNTGNLTLPGSLIVATSIVGSGASPAPSLSGFSSVSAITLSASGNVTGSNLISNSTLYGNIDIILGDRANASATKTRFVSNTEFSYIQTGNGTVGSTGNIVFSPYSSATQRVVINTASGNLSAVGNITAQNFVGNGAALSNVTVSVAGNIIGTQPNVTLVAGSYSTVFDNTGVATFPGNVGTAGSFVGSGAGLTGVALKTLGSWTVVTGTNTYSITVPANGAYEMWVRGNIPDGIITYLATISVTNTNVPVLGTQRAYNYTGGGSPILLVTMPTQIIGAEGTISTAVISGTTNNVFDFVISNTSGSPQTIFWGYVTLS